MDRLRALIPESFRGGALKLAATVPLRALLDLVGVAALLPVMLLVLDPEALRNIVPESLLSLVSVNPGSAAFAIAVVFATIAVLLVKVLLCLLITRSQSRYMMSLYRNLSSRLFISLFSKGLLYVKNQNSSKMAFNVIGVCYNFVMGYLGGMLRLCGESVFVLLLLCALLCYSPVATLLAVLAMAPVVLFYVLIIRRPLREIGKRENEARREQNRIVTETFRGYSEIQVNNAFPQTMQRFASGLDDISAFRVRSAVIQGIPSYMLELVVLAVVGVMMLLSFAMDGGLDPVFIGIFTVAAMKLLPAARTIVSSLSAISQTEYTTEIMAQITDNAADYAPDRNAEPMAFDREVELRDVSFTFPEDSQAVISNLSLSIPKGTVLGIKGRTGVGKTTLFNILLGLYQPQQGGLYVDGSKVDENNMASWHRIVGYVPQDVFVADASIAENVALGIAREDIDREKLMRALERASLREFVDSLPQGADTRIGEMGCKLSGGQRQRLGIARALFKDARILFFDEATSSLDRETELEINHAIASLKGSDNDLTVVVISHRESSLAFCDRIIEL